MPHPTMIRKLKNGMTTGAQSSRGMLLSPVSPAVRLSESIRLPKGGGSVTAKRLRPLSTSGHANNTSPAGFSSFQRPSIAAILEGIRVNIDTVQMSEEELDRH